MFLQYLILAFHCVVTRDLFRSFGKDLLIPATDDYIREGSLFGISMKYSKKDRAFYISAPLAHKKGNSSIKTGIVFKCTEAKHYICDAIFFMPDENSYNRAGSVLRPLYGMTIQDNKADEILICGPNLPTAVQKISFCYLSSRSTGSWILSNPIVPNTKEVNLPDNFGMILEIYRDQSVEQSKYLIGQVNELNYNISSISDSMSKPFLVISSKNGQEGSLPVSNIPSYGILVHPGNDLWINVVIFYYLTNHFKGSFDVITSENGLQQQINVKIGSPNQRFGQSSAFGRFNEDDCLDIATSAPFYSSMCDEGLVYIYYCMKDSKKFNDIPTLLNGENLPLARFGTSIAILRNINDDYYDGIAVLSPNWNENFPYIYIYLSSSSGFSDSFTQKIVIKSDLTIQQMMSYTLISDFDYNNDEINDIALSLPESNIVFAIRGLASSKIIIDFSYENLNASLEPRLICRGSKDNPICDYYSEYITDVCFSLLSLKEKDLLYNIELNYTLSLDSSTGSYFLQSDKYHKNLDGVVAVNNIVNKSCFKENLKFRYFSYSIITPIIITIDAALHVRSYQGCVPDCITADTIHINEYIYDEFWSCNSSNCQPNYILNHSEINQTINAGFPNTQTWQLEITNTAAVKSYFTQVEITLPDFFKIKTAIFMDSKITHFTSYTPDNVKDNKKIFLYRVMKVLSKNEKMNCTFKFDLSPTFQSKGSDIAISVRDPMYKHSIKETVLIPITVTYNNVISIVGKVNPSTIILIMNKKIVMTNILRLLYSIDIYNEATILVKDVIITLYVKTVFEKVKVLSLLNLNMSGISLEEPCSPEEKPDCDQDLIVSKATTLIPRTVYSIFIEYGLPKDVQGLWDIDIKKIELRCTTSVSGLSGLSSGSLIISSKIIKISTLLGKNEFLLIVLACVLPIIILSILIFTIIKLKIVQRLKMIHRRHGKATITF